MVESWEAINAYIVSEEPFKIEWKRQNDRLNFYQSVFDESDWEIYGLLEECGIETRNSKDCVLEDNCLWMWYNKSTHDYRMNLMEQRDLERYKTIRLLLVTGAYLTPENDYEISFKNIYKEFLMNEQVRLRKKVEKAIQERIKPLYEERKRQTLRQKVVTNILNFLDKKHQK